jgi:hypothetical protein
MSVENNFVSFLCGDFDGEVASDIIGGAYG